MLASWLGSYRALQRNARLYLISNVPQAATAGALGVLYTLYLNALGYDTTFIGLVAVVGTIGAGLGIIPANALVERLGWRATLIWSDLIGGVAAALQLLVPVPAVIIITTLGIGASVALVLVVNTPLLAAFSTPAQRTALFGLSNALVFLATVVGSLLGGVLPGFFQRAAVQSAAAYQAVTPLLVHGADARAYELALIVTGAIALPSIVPVLLMSGDGRTGTVDAEVTEARGGHVGGEAERLTTGATEGTEVREGRAMAEDAEDEGEAHVEQSQSPARSGGIRGQRPLGADSSAGPSVRPRLAGVWRVRLAELHALAIGVIGRFAVTEGLVGFGAGIFFPYVNLYFVTRLGMSTAAYGALSALLSVCVALASLAAAPLARRLGVIRTAIAAQVASLPFLVAIGAIPVLAVASVVYLVRGSLMAITNPPLQSYLMDAVPQRQRVYASSAYNVSFQVCWALGAGFGGWLIALAGYRAPFLVAAPFYTVGAALLIVWFGRRHSGDGDGERDGREVSAKIAK